MSRRHLNFKDRTIDLSSRSIRRFSYSSLRIATNNFSDDRLIGIGGSARIYKGNLPNGTLVAVKRYRQLNQPEYELDFLRVVEVMSRIQHKNINQVIGCCVERDHRLLVTEFIDNGSIADLLRDSKRKVSLFDWSTRASVCMGIARGLSYLHEEANPRVIHRDIKSSNILLDQNLTPKITDFDIVDLFCGSDDLPREAAVVGSLVYLDPQYCVTLEYTEKVDVYAFGVVLLEIICGRSAMDLDLDYDDQLITSWVSKMLENDRVLEIVDQTLKDFDMDEVQRFVDVALLCTQREGKRRPSMNEVVLMLHGVCNSVSPAGYSIESSTGKETIEDGRESSTLKKSIVQFSREQEHIRAFYGSIDFESYTEIDDSYIQWAGNKLNRKRKLMGQEVRNRPKKYRNKMAKIAQRELEILDLAGQRYLEWKYDIVSYFKAHGLENTIVDKNNTTEQEKAKALVFLRHNIHESLKTEDLFLEDPLQLWEILKERYGHQKGCSTPTSKTLVEQFKIPGL